MTLETTSNKIKNTEINLPEHYGLLMFNIINIVSKRGGFVPEEYKIVGELFEFLKKELKIEDRLKQQTEDLKDID